MSYTVSKAFPGKRRVSFSCPRCREVLTTKLEAAGEPIDCPTCKQGLVVPGTVELDDQRQEVADAAAKKLAQHQARERGEQIRRQEQAAVATPAPPPPAAPLSYRAADAAPRPVPGYTGLSIASSVLIVYAMLLYLFGAVGVVLSLWIVVREMSTPNPYSSAGPTLAYIVTLMPSLGILFGAAVAHALSAACRALRDIAVNSFTRDASGQRA